MNEAEEFYAANRQAWRDWLETNHTIKTGVWLVYDKGNVRTMSWEDIVQEALCFGWIDSRQMSLSETRNKIYISKRSPKSGWSKINKAHIAELEKQGLIASAGRNAITIAKQKGTWDKFTKSDNLELPPELIKAFTSNKKAAASFAGFSDSAKRIILQWLYDAKRPETLQQRIEQTVEKAQQGLKVR